MRPCQALLCPGRRGEPLAGARQGCLGQGRRGVVLSKALGNCLP